MPNRQEWEKQVREFITRAGDELKKASEDLKRSTDDLKSEAQRVLDEVRKPENQRKLKEFHSWARRTAGHAAELIDDAVHKLENQFRSGKSRSTAAASVNETPTPVAPTGAKKRKASASAAGKSQKGASPAKKTAKPRSPAKKR